MKFLALENVKGSRPESWQEDRSVCKYFSLSGLAVFRCVQFEQAEQKMYDYIVIVFLNINMLGDLCERCFTWFTLI